MRAPLADRREPTGSNNRLFDVLYVLKDKTQYNLLIHAPYTRIGEFRHISNIPPQIW